ncbi:MAG: phosphotransferase [Burkholderiales bacterium]|nr:phosphotransferase [Burkholderiales bacterium]
MRRQRGCRRGNAGRLHHAGQTGGRHWRGKQIAPGLARPGESDKIQAIISHRPALTERRQAPPTAPPVPLDRQHALAEFVAARCAASGARVEPASADASFRRYFRIRFDDGRPSRIVMDAPPEHEDCAPFVRAAALLGACGVNVPRVLEADLAGGFLLLTDLGTRTYLSALNADGASADRLYRDAIDALVRMQAHAAAAGLPPYDRTLLMREMELLPVWYIERHRGHVLTDADRATLASAFGLLADAALAQPQVFVHRDYHSRNLMVCSADEGTGANPGILDFQDAVRGPITYDLVSLLRDAYVEWPEERLLDWAIRYWEAARAAALPVDPSFADFYRAFEWMGLQRHLKVLGIFARLYHRDAKDQYLGDLPLVLRYVRRTCVRYAAFAGLLRLLDRVEGVAPGTGYTF